MEYPEVTADCLHEARMMNRLIGNADQIPQSGLCQADRDYVLGVNARLYPELLAYDVQQAHAEAINIESSTCSRAILDVINERVRQVAECGHSHENDDEYLNEALASQAAAYAVPWPKRELIVNMPRQGMFPPYTTPIRCALVMDGFTEVDDDIPRRQQLVRAAALLIAEIERIDRSAN